MRPPASRFAGVAGVTFGGSETNTPNVFRMPSVSMSSSSAALAIGGMLLAASFVASPLPQDAPLAESMAVGADASGRWLASAVMLFVGSITLTFGAIALRALLNHRDRLLPMIAVIFFAVGTIGMSGYAMILAFLRALVLEDALVLDRVVAVVSDTGFQVFLGAWLVSFLLGLILLAVGMLRRSTTPQWIPLVMLGFVASQVVPLGGGQEFTVVQFAVLALAFTGAAVAANDDAHTDNKALNPI